MRSLTNAEEAQLCMKIEAEQQRQWEIVRRTVRRNDKYIIENSEGALGNFLLGLILDLILELIGGIFDVFSHS